MPVHTHANATASLVMFNAENHSDNVCFGPYIRRSRRMGRDSTAKVIQSCRKTKSSDFKVVSERYLNLILTNIQTDLPGTFSSPLL